MCADNLEKTPNYDLHSHSAASDGVLTPSELLLRAREKGVDMLALTDHDITDGLVEAGVAAAEAGIELIRGVEISVTWEKTTLHILGLNIDPDKGELQRGLAIIREFRAWRATEIALRLEKHGIKNALEGAKKYAKGSIISRTHFAHFLMEQGYARKFSSVFKHFLVANKPGHVPGQWAALEDTLRWIKEAGGEPVIAHPARYKMSATRMRRLLGEFKELGGKGLEVVSSSHSTAECNKMAKYAEQFDLMASRGSDFHNPEFTYADLGAVPMLPPQCRPIWNCWSASA